MRVWSSINSAHGNPHADTLTKTLRAVRIVVRDGRIPEPLRRSALLGVSCRCRARRRGAALVPESTRLSGSSTTDRSVEAWKGAA